MFKYEEITTLLFTYTKILQLRERLSEKYAKRIIN